jgi:uncharacterized tellurite resistance protein B-like protein
MPRTSTHARRRSLPRLSTDQAFIALLIGAMEANQHTSPEEAARAQHIVQSMRRYRRRGAVAGRLIAKMKELVEAHGALAVVAAACRAIPKPSQSAAFAVVADLVLVDGRIEPAERDFLYGVAADLELDRRRVAAMIELLRIKNRA